MRRFGASKAPQYPLLGLAARSANEDATLPGKVGGREIEPAQGISGCRVRTGSAAAVSQRALGVRLRSRESRFVATFGMRLVTLSVRRSEPPLGLREIVLRG